MNSSFSNYGGNAELPRSKKYNAVVVSQQDTSMVKISESRLSRREDDEDDNSNHVTPMKANGHSDSS